MSVFQCLSVPNSRFLLVEGFIGLESSKRKEGTISAVTSFPGKIFARFFGLILTVLRIFKSIPLISVCTERLHPGSILSMRSFVDTLWLFSKKRKRRQVIFAIEEWRRPKPCIDSTWRSSQRTQTFSLSLFYPNRLVIAGISNSGIAFNLAGIS